MPWEHQAFSLQFQRRNFELFRLIWTRVSFYSDRIVENPRIVISDAERRVSLSRYPNLFPWKLPSYYFHSYFFSFNADGKKADTHSVLTLLFWNSSIVWYDIFIHLCFWKIWGRDCLGGKVFITPSTLTHVALLLCSPSIAIHKITIDTTVHVMQTNCLTMNLSHFKMFYGMNLSQAFNIRCSGEIFFPTYHVNFIINIV